MTQKGPNSDGKPIGKSTRTNSKPIAIDYSSVLQTEDDLVGSFVVGSPFEESKTTSFKRAAALRAESGSPARSVSPQSRSSRGKLAIPTAPIAIQQPVGELIDSQSPPPVAPQFDQFRRPDRQKERVDIHVPIQEQVDDRADVAHQEDDRSDLKLLARTKQTFSNIK